MPQVDILSFMVGLLSGVGMVALADFLAELWTGSRARREEQDGIEDRRQGR